MLSNLINLYSFVFLFQVATVQILYILTSFLPSSSIPKLTPNHLSQSSGDLLLLQRGNLPFLHQLHPRRGYFKTALIHQHQYLVPHHRKSSPSTYPTTATLLTLDFPSRLLMMNKSSSMMRLKTFAWKRPII